jgi:hypothetical protein
VCLGGKTKKLQTLIGSAEEKRRKGKEFCIMRKIIIVLAVVMLTAPAWADVKIILEPVDNTTVAVKYDSSGESELVRAFALDLTATGGTIEAVTDFKTGDNNGGYGIFPGNFSRYITVDGQTGEVANWDAEGYTPVADVNDPGAAGGLGDAAITIEMGSLYEDQAPGDEGTLCMITVSEGTTEICATVNEMRGGIVLENAATANADLTDACVELGEPDCFPSTNSQYNDWLAYDKPQCWCEPYHCDGDIDTKEQGFGGAKHRIGLNDLNILIPQWGNKGTEPDYNACADIDHKAQGFGGAKHRVGLNDLNILIANWGAKTAQLPGTCPR